MLPCGAEAVGRSVARQRAPNSAGLSIPSEECGLRWLYFSLCSLPRTFASRRLEKSSQKKRVFPLRQSAMPFVTRTPCGKKGFRGITWFRGKRPVRDEFTLASGALLGGQDDSSVAEWYWHRRFRFAGLRQDSQCSGSAGSSAGVATHLAPLHPRPATIDIHSSEIGRRAVDALLWRIENPDAPRNVGTIQADLLPAVP